MEGEIPFLFNDWFTMSSEKIKNGLESIFISCDLRSCHSTKRLRFSQSESVFFALLLGNQRFTTLILSAQWVRAIANHGLVLTKERKNIKGGGVGGSDLRIFKSALPSLPQFISYWGSPGHLDFFDPLHLTPKAILSASIDTKAILSTAS